MKKHFIAIAAKGSEFLYRKSTAIAVPTKSAAAIAEALNKAQYKIKNAELETWHVYENDWITNDYIENEIRAYSPHKNIKVYRYHG